MKAENLEEVNRSFEIQAAAFEGGGMNFSDADYLAYIVESTRPSEGDVILEVAAGTCACARSFAPHCRVAVCLDATLPMLQVGKRASEEVRLSNMIFVKGLAEELPFLDASFDIVLSRLAFHHFESPARVFSEMSRVLKPRGKLVLIDMEAAPTPYRLVQDEIETLRDPSHVRNLSAEEMLALFSEHGLTVQKHEVRQMRQNLASWLSLTRTPQDVRCHIIERMRSELEGLDKTGFAPYVDGGEIWFNQRWVLTLAVK